MCWINSSKDRWPDAEMRNTFRLLQKEESYFKRGRNFRRKKKISISRLHHSTHSSHPPAVRLLSEQFSDQISKWLFHFSSPLSLAFIFCRSVTPSNWCPSVIKSHLQWPAQVHSVICHLRKFWFHAKGFFFCQFYYISVFLLSSVLTITEYLHLYHGL